MPLVEKKYFDQSNRPIHEFELTGGSTKMSTWMGEFAAPAQIMTKIRKDFPNGLRLVATVDQKAKARG